MTTDQPMAFVVVYQSGDLLVTGPLCKTRECAEQGVDPFEGRKVIGILSGAIDLLDEPVMGMHFALERAK